MSEKQPLHIVCDGELYENLEKAAKREHLALATFCRQKLSMYLEGRLIEAPEREACCPKG